MDRGLLPSPEEIRKIIAERELFRRQAEEAKRLAEEERRGREEEQQRRIDLEALANKTAFIPYLYYCYAGLF